MTNPFQTLRGIILGLALLTSAATASANDWPMWRYDAQRSASSPENLPLDLKPHWSINLGEREQVWDDPLNHDLMPYDRLFEPIVLGDRMFVAFNDRDKVVAYSLKNGKELWTFYTDGPVRLPPVGWQGSIYFACDDGYLYCVDAANGKLTWKFRGAPGAQKVLGNKRLISAWPARGGPVLRDGTIYFSASIWPFMGTFIYALDAKSGEVQWINDGTSADYIKQPHSAPSFAGVAPQGAFVATKDVLLVPGGRSVPAAFDRKTGELLHFRINDGGKGNGGSFVIANDSEFFVHTRLRGVRAYDMKTGKKGSFTLNEPVLSDDAIYTASPYSIKMTQLRKAEASLASARKSEALAKREMKSAKGIPATAKASAKLATAQAKIKSARVAIDKATKSWNGGWKGPVIQAYSLDKKLLWEIEGNGLGDLIRAGNRLYAAGSNELSVIEIPVDGKEPEVISKSPLPKNVQRLLAANGHLIAVTLDGEISCYGEGVTQVKRMGEPLAKPVNFEVTQPQKDLVEMKIDLRLTKEFGSHKGHCLWFGPGNETLLHKLVYATKLQIIAVTPNRDQYTELRNDFDYHNDYGKRIAIHHGNPLEFKAPPYLARLLILSPEAASNITDAQSLNAIYQSVRPYGGVLWMHGKNAETARIAALAKTANLEKAKITLTDEGLKIVREGALPDSADWTHQYGDIANTVKSDDRRLKLPLGVLWFGGNSNADVLPRHGHGPPELVIGGRTFLEGINSLSARDVYTGRVLWKRDFEDLGTFGIYYNETYKDTPLDPAYNQRHIPGANGRGSNFTATEDTVYLALGSECLAIDSATGETRSTIKLPKRAGQSEPPGWGFIGVYEDTLLGGHGFANFSKKFARDGEKVKPSIEDYSASDGLIAYDRHTGKQLWRVKAKHSFLHNGIVAGGGRVYLLDKLPGSAESKLTRRGKPAPADYRILAIDSRTGKTLWETTENITGTWLGYSGNRDILLHAGASASDRLRDEVSRGMTALTAKDGSVLWSRPKLSYSGPCILHNDLIVANANQHSNRRPNYDSSTVFNLLDGSDVLIENPITGLEEPWRIERGKGCNSIIACENFLTFRDGAASYYDLKSRNGIGSLGGFKSGCTANLVVANGVLNAPDYTRTCSCSYQNQTSLALVHMPDLEMWTSSLVGTRPTDNGRIKRLGINLGAPGDRQSAAGTLWIEYPAVGGATPAVAIETTGKDLRYFRRNASQVRAKAEAWITASGALNLESISIRPRLATAAQRSQTNDQTLRLQPGSSKDTAEETAKGSVGLTSSDLEIVEDKKNTQVVGIRIPNVNLNSADKLERAFLQFVVDETGKAETRLEIRAQASDNAPAFTNKNKDLTSRKLTKARVTWKPKAWNKTGEAGKGQQTPDLAPLIAEVTKRKGWKSGNAIAFIITGSGKRVAKSNGKPAPTLVAELTNAPKPAPTKKEPEVFYTVRLHFLEPENLKPGDRVFDVAIQGKTVLKGFDIRAEAGGSLRGIVREFKRVPVTDALKIDLIRSQKSAAGPALGGVEMIAEGAWKAAQN